MTERNCTVDDCGAPIKARGLCMLHYGRAYRAGERARMPRRVSDVDPEAMTCTCPIHGTGVRLRIRVRKPGRRPSYSCRKCERGVRRPPKRSRSGVSLSVGSRVYYAYGVSDEEIRLRIEAQQGCCLICSDLLIKPMIDHDHEGGQVRGILCIRCNAGLGFFRDNADALAKAAKYIRRYAS